MGQDAVQVDTFWGVLNVSLCASGAQLGLAVSQGVQTDPLKEVVIFGVSQGPQLLRKSRISLSKGGPN